MSHISGRASYSSLFKVRIGIIFFLLLLFSWVVCAFWADIGILLRSGGLILRSGFVPCWLVPHNLQGSLAGCAEEGISNSAWILGSSEWRSGDSRSLIILFPLSAFSPLSSLEFDSKTDIAESEGDDDCGSVDVSRLRRRFRIWKWSWVTWASNPILAWASPSEELIQLLTSKAALGWLFG